MTRRYAQLIYDVKCNVARGREFRGREFRGREFRGVSGGSFGDVPLMPANASANACPANAQGLLRLFEPIGTESGIWRQRRKGSLRDYDAETGCLAARGNCSVLLLRPRPPVENGRPPLSLPALDRDPDSVPFAEATSLPNVELGHHGAQLFGRAEAPPPIL